MCDVKYKMRLERNPRSSTTLQERITVEIKRNSTLFISYHYLDLQVLYHMINTLRAGLRFARADSDVKIVVCASSSDI